VSGYRVVGNNPFLPDATTAILAPFTGEAMTLDSVRAAAAAFEAALHERGYRFLRVVLPAQDTGGVITLQVLEFKLGSVNISGNKQFRNANIMRSLPALKPGESPNLREIARAQALANDHPVKQVSVTMRPGSRPDTVDADVKVEESDPQQVFATFNNAGNRQTGHFRLGAGYQHSNLFDRDQAVTATYTTSPGHTSDVKQYGLYYRAPVYSLHGALSAYYTASDTNSGTVANFFQVSGRGEFAGVRWTHRLLPLGSYGHSADVGVEDRYFENNVAFNGTPIGTNVRSRPLLLRYEGRWDAAGYGLRHSIEFAHNLGGGGSNNDAAYSANRAGATSSWQAWRYSLEAHRFFGAWIATVRLRGQLSGDALIPGEQFALGGAGWVRGLQEREGTGDTGHVLNLELLSQPIAEGVRALAFLDMGRARLKDAVSGSAGREGATSVGLGLRAALQRRLSVSADWAHVTNGAGATPNRHNHAHVSVLYRF
jgi:hemolysin activation/secretion protein